MIKIFNYYFEFVENEYSKIYLFVAADNYKNALNKVNKKLHDIYFISAIEEGIKVNFLHKEEL